MCLSEKIFKQADVAEMAPAEEAFDCNRHAVPPAEVQKIPDSSQ
jgi:hypothetical protein